MAMLPAIALVASLAGTAMAAAGKVQEGRAAQAASNYQAKWDQQAGAADFAAGQRQALSQERNLDAVQGRQMALAAASGAGANISDIWDQTAGQGDLNARSALYQGQQRQQAYNAQGDDAVFRGGIARTAGNIAGAGVGLSGVSKALSNANWGDFNFG